MPLSKIGKKILKEFELEYGKKRGRLIFYAYENKMRHFNSGILKK